MDDAPGAAFAADALQTFRRQKDLADRAAAQLPDEEFFRPLGDTGISVAIVLRHLAGNLRSRWRDFLTTEGEKPDRDRDGEFDPPPGLTRARVMADWEEAWGYVEGSIGSLTAADLTRTVSVRGERLTVIQAIDRQLAHCAYHVGQVVLLAKHWRGAQWQTLSIPKAPPRYPRTMEHPV
ncbi:MAG: DUF1572 family protein [Gemmatimonadota bacterium]